MTINSFTGPYRFLSNFWTVKLEYEGQRYPSVEHAFQAAKTLDLAARSRIAVLPTSAAAKRAGRTVALRDDWERVRVPIMEQLLRLKFDNPELRTKLLSTGDAVLIEGNTWGDTFWGVCRGAGENRLGRLLMVIRDELRRQQ